MLNLRRISLFLLMIMVIAGGHVPVLDRWINIRVINLIEKIIVRFGELELVISAFIYASSTDVGLEVCGNDAKIRYFISIYELSYDDCVDIVACTITNHRLYRHNKTIKHACSCVSIENGLPIHATSNLFQCSCPDVVPPPAWCNVHHVFWLTEVTFPDSRIL